MCQTLIFQFKELSVRKGLKLDDDDDDDGDLRESRTIEY
jgi:hypothetical protein